MRGGLPFGPFLPPYSHTQSLARHPVLLPDFRLFVRPEHMLRMGRHRLHLHDCDG